MSTTRVFESTCDIKIRKNKKSRWGPCLDYAARAMNELDARTGVNETVTRNRATSPDPLYRTALFFFGICTERKKHSAAFAATAADDAPTEIDDDDTVSDTIEIL